MTTKTEDWVGLYGWTWQERNEEGEENERLSVGKGWTKQRTECSCKSKRDNRLIVEAERRCLIGVRVTSERSLFLRKDSQVSADETDLLP